MINIEEIREQIAKGNTKTAIQHLKEGISQNDFPDLYNQIFAISGSYEKVKKEFLNGLTTNTEMNTETNKVNFRILELLNDFKTAYTNKTHTATAPNDNETTDNQSIATQAVTVFISYNHGDRETAQKLKTLLLQNNVNVTIDEEAMEAGSKIKDFIENSILNTNITLSVVSNKSLLSAWVAIETINSFYHQKFGNKKFIAVYTDSDFFNPRFRLDATKKIDAKILELDNLIKEYMEYKIDSSDLNEEKTRLFHLRNNLGDILNHLKGSLCIDISGDNLTANFPKILKAISC